MESSASSTPANLTPLPPVDRGAVKAFLASANSAIPRLDADTDTEAGFFGDSVELADELIGLILHGPKRATASAVADYEADDEKLPELDDLWVGCDGKGAPRALLRTTDIRVGPLSSVDAQFAWDEGEGDRSREYWLDAHTRVFKRRLRSLGLEFNTDIAVVFERFDLVYSQP